MYDICNILTHVHTNYTHTHTHHRFNVLCSHLSATCWLNGLIKIQLLEHQLLQAARVLWSHAHGHHQLSASPTLSFRSPLTAFISPEGRGCHQMRHTRRCLCTATHWLTRSIHPLVIAAITQLHICCSLAPAQEHSEIHTVFKICTRKAPTQDSSLTDVDNNTSNIWKQCFSSAVQKTSQNMTCLLHHRLRTNFLSVIIHLSPGRCSFILSNGQQKATRPAAKCSWSYRKAQKSPKSWKHPTSGTQINQFLWHLQDVSSAETVPTGLCRFNLSCRRWSENLTGLLLMFQQWILQCLDLTPPTVCSAGMLLHSLCPKPATAVVCQK